MVSIHCTNKLFKALKLEPHPHAGPPLNRLGGWYANIVPTPAGEVVLCTSETSSLSVLIPVFMLDDLLPMFVMRVEHQLRQLNVPSAVIESEIAIYSNLVLVKTASRKVLATMNRIADDLWYSSEAKLKRSKEPLSVSDAEAYINALYRGPQPYFKPAERAREILLAPPEND